MADSRQILVTGANGQLGCELRTLALTASGYAFTFTDVAELDITDSEAVEAFVQQLQPHWIINAAAYTAVDRAETDADRAQLLNATAVENLVQAAAGVEAGVVQVSTDYVFDGLGPHVPLTEEAPTNPQSIYGHTKRAGELAALAYPRSLVVRTAWLYSVHGQNFVKTMRRLGAEREEIGVVNDQWGAPTHATDLAAALLQMIAALDNGRGAYGLYHYTDQGETTWCDFAAEVMRQSHLSCRVKGIPTTEYPTPAPRPSYSGLSKDKIRRIFGITPPPWKQSLARCIALLQEL